MEENDNKYLKFKELRKLAEKLVHRAPESTLHTLINGKEESSKQIYH